MSYRLSRACIVVKYLIFSFPYWTLLLGKLMSVNIHGHFFFSMSYQLSVGSVVIYSGWFGNFKRAIAASNPFYFGGIPTSLKIPFTVPTHVSLTMDVQSFVINNRLVQHFLKLSCYLDSSNFVMHFCDF